MKLTFGKYKGKEIDGLKFDPIIRFASKGNEIQRCRTIYKNTTIIWETFFPYNIFKDPTDIFTVDRIVSEDQEINNATINVNYYTEEGYGYPEFKELEHAIEYIDGIYNQKP